MKTWVRKSVNVGVLSAGFLLVAGSAAQADASWTTGNNAGLGNGNQLGNTLQVPVDISGNAVSVLGFASADSTGGASANTESASTESWTTGYNAGILSGNQISNTIQAPISVCGNSVAVLGFADASCTGGAAANTGGSTAGDDVSDDSDDDGTGSNNGGYGDAAGDDSGYESTRATTEGGSWVTGYNAGVLSGNQLSNTVQVPVDVSGNAIGVLGFASASSTGGASANTESTTEGTWTTGYNAGIANGNQVSNLVQVPISVCGNSVAVLGFADASCTGGAVANSGGSTAGDDSDDDGTGSNNGGYDASAASNKHHHKAVGRAKVHNSRGHHKGEGKHRNSGSAASTGGDTLTTGYNAGVLTGNQLVNKVQIPVDISGNAVSLLGFASASSTGGAWANA